MVSSLFFFSEVNFGYIATSSFFLALGISISFQLWKGRVLPSLSFFCPNQTVPFHILLSQQLYCDFSKTKIECAPSFCEHKFYSDLSIVYCEIFLSYILFSMESFISCFLSFKIIVINLTLISLHQFCNCVLRIFRYIRFFYQINFSDYLVCPTLNLFTSASDKKSFHVPSSSFWGFPLPLFCVTTLFLLSHMFLVLLVHFFILVQIICQQDPQ